MTYQTHEPIPPQTLFPFELSDDHVLEVDDDPGRLEAVDIRHLCEIVLPDAGSADAHHPR